jgi:hypothetical protein
MPDTPDSHSLRVVSDITAIAPGDWDRCAGTANPFVRHAFLRALETSGSAVGETGWLPQHAVLQDTRGTVLAVAPLYLKSHSFGEYVFDWAWADAYERAGGRYYPKLQAAVPFTPVTGPRLLVRGDLDPDAQAAARTALAQGLIRIAERHGVSSLHVTFPEAREWDVLGRCGYLQRTGLQFRLDNPGYEDFADFLAALASRKRKQIRRERREVAEQGIRVHRLVGPDIAARHWDAFYAFYCATADKRWGVPYLAREFFHEIGEAMGERVLLVLAEDAQGRPVAGALNLIGDDTLYGRNWGAAEDHAFLHFEACYYQAIEFAIERGLSRVEAGAQGEHKLQRGYLPVTTYSAHWIADPGLADPVADFVQRERRAVAEHIAELSAHSPYKQHG